MDISEASENIKKLYQTSNSTFSSEYEAERIWQNAISDFHNALELENDPEKLETCVLDDSNWRLHVNGRLALLKKTKALGANSRKFLMDYYGYLAAHLDPSLEKEEADLQLSKLLNSSST